MPATATPADWQKLTADLTRAAERSGLCGSDSDDIAQEIVASHWEGRFAKDAATTGEIFGRARAVARRAGTWLALTQTGDRDRKRGWRARQNPETFRFHVVDDRPFPSPATMAAAAEAKGFPVARIHEAYGIGPTALAEPNTTPSVCGSGPGWTMPEPIPADRYPTDPNPISRIVSALAVANDARRVAGLPPVG